MKVLIFSRFPRDVNQPRGGVETATLGLVNALVENYKIDIHVITLENSLHELEVIEHQDYTVHRLPGTNWPMFLDLLFGPGKRKLKKYICELQPDVVHYQETYGLGLSNIPYPNIFTIHGFDSRNLVTEKKKLWWVRRLIWKLVEDYTIAKHKNLVSITPYVRDEISQTLNADIYDIENAINKEFFDIQVKTQAGMIFYAAWINPRKNLMALVKAIDIVRKQFPSVLLYAAGEASDKEYYSEITGYIQENNLADNIKLLGRIPQSEIREYLSKANVFALPSRQENAPMAIAEAMAVGVPVISSNVCGMPYMLNDGVTGFLTDPDDYKTIAEKILLLLSDQELSNEMVRNAKEEAYKRYHPDSVARRTYELYERVIKKN